MHYSLKKSWCIGSAGNVRGREILTSLRESVWREIDNLGPV